MPSLDHILSTLPAAPHIRGRAFERLCAWYLLHDPVYAAQVKRVWLWNEWPGRWEPDAVIDLVAETHDGALWAVQAKCYAPTTRVTKADIDSFLSESNRKEIAFRLLIATTDGIAPNARHVTRGQEKPASLLLLSDLLASTVQWPQALDGPDPAPRAALTPRPHQTEALYLRQERSSFLSSELDFDVTLPSASASDVLVNFKMVICDPVYMSSLLGATSFTDAHGFSHNVEVNDPNVYRAKTGEYVMIIHCDILGGLVRLTADSATFSDTTPQC